MFVCNVGVPVYKYQPIKLKLKIIKQGNSLPPHAHAIISKGKKIPFIHSFIHFIQSTINNQQSTNQSTSFHFISLQYTWEIMISTYSRIGLTTLTKSSSSSSLTTTVRPLLLANFTRGIKTIPQPPGYIVGTVNDAYVPPPPHKLEGSLHWTSERIVAIGMLPLVLAPFITGGGVGGGASTLIDSTMSALLLFHCHTGFQSCIIDYIPKRVYGSYHNYAMYLLTFGTGIAGYGIYQIETKEGGVSNIISKLWKA